ncbi:hypothetical protein V6Z11_A09G116700 [Gossypium hirsutum]
MVRYYYHIPNLKRNATPRDDTGPYQLSKQSVLHLSHNQTSHHITSHHYPFHTQKLRNKNNQVSNFKKPNPEAKAKQSTTFNVSSIPFLQANPTKSHDKQNTCFFFTPNKEEKEQGTRTSLCFGWIMMAGEGVSRETQMSIQASSMFPGFRFSPTDVELISYYLKKKLDGYDKCVEVIPEIEICRYEPWDLPAKSIIKSDNEWFFFCARGRKYPNGSQSRRATEQGYWKATGKERNVKSGSNVIGTKRTLVFHTGRAPKGERTEWIMHEYCMKGKSQDSLVVCRLRKNSEFCLNNNSNRVARNHRELSIVHDSNHATSDGGTDLTGISEGDKAIEFYSKKATSSNDSHSIEQIDSASESEQKLSNEVAPTESSTLKKVVKINKIGGFNS